MTRPWFLIFHWIIVGTNIGAFISFLSCWLTNKFDCSSDKKSKKTAQLPTTVKDNTKKTPKTVGIPTITRPEREISLRIHKSKVTWEDF